MTAFKCRGSYRRRLLPIGLALRPAVYHASSRSVATNTIGSVELSTGRTVTPVKGQTGDPTQYPSLCKGDAQTRVGRVSEFGNRESTISPPYKECPFCDRVFEIGTAEDGPMKRYIRITRTRTKNGSHRGTRQQSETSGLDPERVRNERDRDPTVTTSGHFPHSPSVVRRSGCENRTRVSASTRRVHIKHSTVRSPRRLPFSPVFRDRSLRLG